MAKKTFPYSVIVNGKIIPPDTPVEIDKPKNEAGEKPKNKAGNSDDNEGTV